MPPRVCSPTWHRDSSHLGVPSGGGTTLAFLAGMNSKVMITAIALAGAACGQQGEESDGYRKVGEPPIGRGDGAHRIAQLLGLHGPESARYDPDLDVFYVSNNFGLLTSTFSEGSIERPACPSPTSIYERKEPSCSMTLRSAAPFHSQVYAITPGDTRRLVLVQGTGKFDGLELLGDGRMLVASWADSAVHAFSGDGARRLAVGVLQPADIGVDTRRQRVAVPSSFLNRLELWELDRRN